MDAARPTPPVTSPSIDVGELLRYLVGETGIVQESMGGFKIKVFHTRAFPWDDVFKTALYRDFKVYITRHKAELFIEITT